MQEARQKNKRIHTGKRTTIWLSMVVAISMHVVFLYLPVSINSTQSSNDETLVALQLTKRPPPVEAPVPVTPQATPALPGKEPSPEQEKPPEIDSELINKVTETPPGPKHSEPATSIPQSLSPYTRTSFENMTDTQKKSLTSSILAQQFIREKSVTEQLFGNPLKNSEHDQIAEFHYPARTSMIKILNQPMPDLPFAYQENLIYFAYEPGLKGDLQRFWDVITPEFGWRTRNGTEVRCIWILVMGGCAWK